ncbi:MAG: GGDEF domain-containing protein [Nitrospirae bacterium]|nr:GGDEF domain-containing protein [Nitrospirota bacterium]
MATSNVPHSKMPYFAYLLVLVPWLTEYLEDGHLATSPRGLITELTLAVILGIGIHILLSNHRKLLQQKAEMERLAYTDPLTTLGNPRALEEALVKEIARARRMDRFLSCIFFDLDDFKAINARFGHTAGNSVLQVIGKSVQAVIRHDMDLAFRYGGDEFMIILPEADKAQAYLIAQRLHQALSSLRPPVIPIRTLTASIGIAQLRPEQNAMDLLSLVDEAMREAKTRGKNLIFDAEDLEKDLSL